MGYKTFTTLFQTNIASILDYGCEVIGYQKFKECDKVQLKAQRFFLGISSLSPIPMIQGDMAWKSGYNRRKLTQFRFWNRLVKMDDIRLPKKLWRAVCVKKTIWFEKLLDFDKNNVFEEDVKDCYPLDLRLLPDILKEKDSEMWKKEVKKKPKLRTYLKIKENYTTENYVTLNLSREQRSFLAQLRSGTLPIRLETGRFVREKSEDRICQQCELQKVEDEIHFLFECELYNDVRKDFFDENVEEGFNGTDFELLALLNSNKSRALAKYIKQCWEIRNENVYI